MPLTEKDLEKKILSTQEKYLTLKTTHTSKLLQEELTEEKYDYILLENLTYKIMHSDYFSTSSNLEIALSRLSL